MKYFNLLILLAVITASRITAQELYVFSEPASNMPSKSIGVRITTEGMFRPEFSNRTMPEVMVGFNKNLMTHVQGFFSNMDGGYKFEGASLYAKYRFLSLDGNKSHLRGSGFARISSSNRTVYSEDINLEGDNTGWQAGVVMTQLLKKLALSGTLSYSKTFSNNVSPSSIAVPDQMLGYSLSSGYLLLPFVYKNYDQPNLNLYFEILGKTNPANGNSYLDFAPAVQIVLNSRTRIDLGYRFEIAGGIPNRYTKNMYLARVEFNFFNVWN